MIGRGLMLAAMVLPLGVGAASEDYVVELGPSFVQRQISSGSGMVATPNGYLVVGDDSPYLFEIDARFKMRDKELLKPYPVSPKGRINKDIKPDYEAMAQFRHQRILWNLIVGSGSKSGDRERGVMISADRTFRYERSLASLYRQFYELGGLSGKQRINIEGLAIAQEQVYFFNRGNSAKNMIFVASLNSLVDYMQGRLERIEDLQRIDAQLPSLAGLEAGFSGADYWPQTDALLYTASLEATGDAYGDGEVLGSYVGLIHREKLVAGQPLDLRESATRLVRKNKGVKTKLESVAISESDARAAHGALVSDNDDGTSVFFRFSLRLRP